MLADRNFPTTAEVRNGKEGGDTLSVQFYVHSDYSLLQSALSVEQLVKRARELSIEMLALTDYNTTAGHYELQRYCQAAGIKPIFGLELDVEYSGGEQAPIVLIARTNEGYQNILRLASRPVPVPLAALAQYKEGIAILEGGGRGRLSQLARSGRTERALSLDAWYKEHFGSSYYLRRELGEQPGLAEYFQTNRFILCQDVRYADAASCEALGILAKSGRFEPIIPPYPMLSWDQLREKFSGPEEVIEQTLKLARDCRAGLARQQILPPHPAGDDLGRLARGGAADRYGHVGAAVKERLEQELAVIEELGFSDYFLIVADIVRFAKNAGIAVGPGRGSAAGSLTAYCLGITDVDPLQWGLLFERFLNKARRSRPDIDLDFCYERRGEVLAYVAERFGREHVAQIGTYGTFSRRSAAQEIKRLYGREHPAAASQIAGLKRHRSTHAAGVIVTGPPVQNISAVYTDRHMPVTHLDMYSLEALGVLKIDLLGLRTLTLLQRIEAEIGRSSPDFSLGSIPLQDRAAFELLGRGDTLGIFQLESELFQDLLRSLQPRSFADLVALLALGRPGPLKMFPAYLKNRQRPEQVEYAHPALKEILGETHGLILYQEQLMLIAHRLGGLTLGEADLFRRALGERDRQAVEAWHEKFCSGARQNGMDAGAAEELYQMTVRFSGYAFNKAHSVSYAVITWRMAYVKANYPLEFFLTLLNETGPGEQRTALLLDCQSLGVRVLPPSVLYSQAGCTAEGRALRLGLTAVQGVNTQIAEQIIASRRRRLWPGFSVFRRTPRLERGALQNLILAGACDGLGPREGLLKEIGEEVPPALELLQKERDLVGAYLSRHPASPFLPLVEYFKEDLQVIVGEVLKAGRLDTPTGLALYRGGQGQPRPGARVALFGLMESGVFQTKWALQLGPTLLASPRPEQLAALKEILAGQKAGEDGGGRFPVVLRLGEGALHLLPPELWVGDVSAIEGSLDRGELVYTWFDPWKERVS